MFQGLSQSVGITTVANLPGSVPKVDANQAQHVINAYRDQKAEGYPGTGIGEAIGDAVKNRNVSEQRGMDYVINSAPSMGAPEEFPDSVTQSLRGY
jgi:hypothetical protein